MENEYYYLAELESRMIDFINDEVQDGEAGWLPDNISRRMAEAAFAVLKNNKELSDYFKEQELLIK